MKKVLHINSNYGYSALHGQMIEGLAQLGIENTIFFPMQEGITLPEEKTGECLAIPCFTKWDKFSFYLKQKKISKALENAVNVAEYGLIHAYTLFTDGNLAYTLSKKYGTPYVVAVRNTDVNFFLKYRKYLTPRGKEIIRNASKVFFLSPEYKKQVLKQLFDKEEQERLEKKIHIIPNGIGDFWHENAIEGEKELSKKSLNLIFAGRVNKQKNIVRTAMAAEALQKKGYTVKFTVVGKLEELEVLERLKAYDFVQYIEQKPKEELIKLYREHDIFVMPSKVETFGLVYPEAMSQGLPVIYTKGQGFDGQFPEGEVGYSVDCEDTDEIVASILKIVDNYKEIRSRAMEGAKRFNWSRICQEYKDIYHEIMKK